MDQQTRTPERADWADAFASVVIANLTAEYPFAAHHVTAGATDARLPADLHPAFATSFDWHSSVHMHWLATQLLAFGVAAPLAARLEGLLTRSLTAENLRVEAAYLRAEPDWERPYGWGWALRLAAAVADSPVPGIRALAPHLVPLADAVADLAGGWVDTVPEPVRHGVHPNSAFGLRLLLEASRALGRDAVAETCERAALRWFGDDRGWPVDWERSGQDFLSAGLAEADLMRVVLPADAFAVWLEGFLAELRPDSPLLRPALVLDATDPLQTHLYGLDLHRAAAGSRIAVALPAADAARSPRLAELRDLLAALPERLLPAGLAASVSDDYASTHWLATFGWDALCAIEAARAA
jgi:Protein of unknown function (DUF2891)